MIRLSPRHLLVTAALAALVVTAGACAPGQAPVAPGPSNPPASPTASAPVPSPTAAPPAEFQLSVRGAGPYQIGARLEQLRAAGLVDSPSARQGCDGVVDAGATGHWAGHVLLVFRHDVLVGIGGAGEVKSPAGVGPGMSFAEAERIYGDRGRPIRSKAGKQGYVVGVGNMIELFTDHPIRPGIGYFEVAQPSAEQAFVADSEC